MFLKAGSKVVQFSTKFKVKWLFLYLEIYWLAGTGTAQLIISTAKLSALSNILKNSIVTKGLALILFLNIKHSTNNLWHLWESIYECVESAILKCSKKLSNLRKNILRPFPDLTQLPLTLTGTELGCIIIDGVSELPH